MGMKPVILLMVGVLLGMMTPLLTLVSLVQFMLFELVLLEMILGMRF